MENYSYASYPDSVNSSPRSREIDCENASWDEPPSSNYKVKLMCSYGGKIHPRPHDNQLTYAGGETKILSVDRNIRFSNLITKLSSITECEVCFKYQLPGEDLDALISVTNDEDLEHMMLEYDRVHRGSAKPARLRLFLFPLNPPAANSNFGSSDSKSENQWFVDSLNFSQLQNVEASSPHAPSAASSAAGNPDFLFGLDKNHAPPPANAVKQQDPTPTPTPTPPVPEVYAKEIRAGSDCGSEDRHVIGDPVDFQRQIHEMQRLHISNQEQQQQQQAMYNRKLEESIPTRVYAGEYYQPKSPPPPQQQLQQQQQSVPVTNTTAFWPERHMTSGPYNTEQQHVYLVQTPAGVYQTPGIRPASQAYYGMQRMAPPEVYREQAVYGGVPPQATMQHQMRNQAPATEQTYAQVGYDGAVRQVYYTAPAGMMQQQQMQHPVMDGRQSGGALNPDARIVGKPSQTSL